MLGSSRIGYLKSVAGEEIMERRALVGMMLGRLPAVADRSRWATPRTDCS